MRDLYYRINDKVFNRASEADLGYIAGIIDADGGFYLYVRHRNGHKSFLFHMKIHNTSFKLFKYLHKVGVECYFRQRKDRIHIRPYYVMTLCNNDIRKVLPKIIKYLVIKKRQAKLMLKGLKLTAKNSPHGKYSKEIEEISKQIKLLNQGKI